MSILKRHISIILGIVGILLGGMGRPGIGWGVEIRDLPEKVELAGFGDVSTLANLLQKRPVLIVVGSHATFPLLEELPFRWHARHWTMAPEQFLGVAAVNKAPWLVKKLLATSSLRQIKEERDIRARGIIDNLDRSQVVVDRGGDMVAALHVEDLGKKGYAAFMVDRDGSVHRLFQAELPGKEEAKVELLHAADAILDRASSSFNR
ncbi:MAG: hypothetical protein HQL89_04235 [Magnetococcales bacterium]|nr:hypothetical protein [Magnetococcales bacterium]